MGRNKKEERLGQIKINNQGCPMRIVKYINKRNMTVEFDDEHKTRVNCQWHQFEKGNVVNPYIYECRLGEKRLNNQGSLMVIVVYNSPIDIIVEFQDEYKIRVHTNYKNFQTGAVRNPYHPSICGVGVVGNKYYTWISEEKKRTREYSIWMAMIHRCFDNKVKEKHPTYKDATCCNEWLLYENFYEWLHSQENFDKWIDNKNWHLDKDVLVKGNKIYSPETCCLVPQNINSLFTKHDIARGNYPIGISYHKRDNKFMVQCNNPFTNKRTHIGGYKTLEEAFQSYKEYKENIIKQVAEIEYDKGNITKQCYEAMLNYVVEIDD